jgi:hypothetical protein
VSGSEGSYCLRNNLTREKLLKGEFSGANLINKRFGNVMKVVDEQAKFNYATELQNQLTKISHKCCLKFVVELWQLFSGKNDFSFLLR